MLRLRTQDYRPFAVSLVAEEGSTIWKIRTAHYLNHILNLFLSTGSPISFLQTLARSPPCGPPSE